MVPGLRLIPSSAFRVHALQHHQPLGCAAPGKTKEAPGGWVARTNTERQAVSFQ